MFVDRTAVAASAAEQAQSHASTELSSTAIAFGAQLAEGEQLGAAETCQPQKSCEIILARASSAQTRLTRTLFNSQFIRIKCVVTSILSPKPTSSISLFSLQCLSSAQMPEQKLRENSKRIIFGIGEALI
jgi:hypothetical protein